MSKLTLNTKFRLAILIVALLIMLVLLLSFSFISSSDDYPKKYSLYVSLFDAGNVKQLKQDIWKYTFENGLKISEENIMSVFGKKDGALSDLVRTDIGESKIFANRYLVTGTGNIIDLQKKAVLTDQKSTFLRQSNDSLIFYTNDAFRGKFYSVLKMNDGVYEEVKSALFRAMPGQDVGVDYDLQNRRIWYYPPKGDKKLLVQDAGFGEEVLKTKSTAVIPVYWTDNWNFLFPYYGITKDKATIISVNVKTGEQIKVGDIPDMPKSEEASYFSRDPDNNLLYVCPKGNLLIDVKGKSVKLQEYYHCGNKFDVQVSGGANGRIIKHKGNEIGKHHCELKSVRDCRSAIALEKKMKVGSEVYSQGIGVWNVHSKKWSTIMADNIAAVLGWVEE